jgi:hypothetical protein
VEFNHKRRVLMRFISNLIRSRPPVVLTVLAALGCAGTSEVIAPEDSSTPLFDVQANSLISFDVTSFATLSDGTIVDPGDCNYGSLNWYFTYTRDRWINGAWVPSTDSVHVYDAYRIKPCNPNVGVYDVVGTLDGVFRWFGSQKLLNTWDTTHVLNFPVGVDITLAATPNGGCYFYGWRKDHPFTGELVGTDPSSTITPVNGATYFAVVTC